jgi:hypothetical protein
MSPTVGTLGPGRARRSEETHLFGARYTTPMPANQRDSKVSYGSLDLLVGSACWGCLIPTGRVKRMYALPMKEALQPIALRASFKPASFR